MALNSRLLLFVLTTLVSGCATVPAYQRGLLMSPVMQGPTELESMMDGHVDGTRELMNGASGAGGASCGCT